MAMMTTIEKILAKAVALEAQAAALRLAVTLLNGDLKEHKQATAQKTIDQAIALRYEQKNGAPLAEAKRRGRPPGQKKREKHTPAMFARRLKKRAQILAILKAYGKPMPVAELAAAARKKGIPSLTGISGSVLAGYIKQTGQRGDTHYSLPTTAD